MSIIVENEKVFEYFGEMFPEIRKVMIDEMPPVERCRFTRCAKFCQKEAKKSKNYIYGLSLRFDPILSNSRVRIFVEFDKPGNGFILNFCIDRQTGKKWKNCENQLGQELWSTELDSSTNVICHGVEEFENIVYQNTIQWLYIEGSREFPKKYDFEIQSLKNLTKLEIWCDLSISKIFSKLRKPLEELDFDGNRTTQNIVDFEEIYQVQNKITLHSVMLNYEQLTRLSARHIVMPIGYSTEMEIFNLIRSWQNSTDWKATQFYEWCLRDSGFSVQQLLNLLGIGGFNDQDSHRFQKFAIKHFKNDQKVGHLHYFRQYLVLTLER